MLPILVARKGKTFMDNRLDFGERSDRDLMIILADPDTETEDKQGAVTVIWHRHSNYVLEIVEKELSRSRGWWIEAWDVVQEIFAAFLDPSKMPAQFDKKRCSLEPWLRRCATNRTIDYLRRSSRSKLSDPSSIENRPGSSRNILEELVAKEDIARLKAGLSAEEQTLFQLRFTDGLSPEDTAEALGLSLETVYKQTFQLREKLRRAVANFFE